MEIRKTYQEKCVFTDNKTMSVFPFLVFPRIYRHIPFTIVMGGGGTGDTADEVQQLLRKISPQII